MLQQQLEKLRLQFNSGVTRPYSYRKAQLQRLRDEILKEEEAIYAALFSDLKKSKEEVWATEIGLVIAEIKMAITKLPAWMADEKVGTNLLNFPSTSRIVKEPLGVVLIIAPWNYPFQLLMSPLVGAIAAGNAVVLKPSEFAPATAAVMKKIILCCFNPEYVLYVEGDGAAVVPAMLQHFTFDHVFYTGSTGVGRQIYSMAAARLVPVTLELGGKSPCVVEADANITVAAKRIALTKFSNAGQMCVAPDYLLVHYSVKTALIDALKKAIIDFYGPDSSTHYNYGKIINQKQFDRIAGYLKEGKIVYGGKTDASALFIEPTLLDDIIPEARIMQEEIFGPVLPIISFDSIPAAMAIIEQHKNPLAFYVFTSSREKETAWLRDVAFGGGCINNASLHLTNPNLPFGGRGFSGTGAYHGKASFNTFTHRKSVMKSPTWFDPAAKYPPFKGKLKLFKWVIR